MSDKQIHIFGGGTVSHVRNHLALAAPAYGGTAKTLALLCAQIIPKMEVVMHLTRMAQPDSKIETTGDLRERALEVRDNPKTKIVFFNAAVADFDGYIPGGASGKHAPRLRTADGLHHMHLTPPPKIITGFRKGDTGRKDLFLVGFKTTCGATPAEQYEQGLNMLKASSANLVLANDTLTRNNMIIAPEESVYCETADRLLALTMLVEMAFMRSHLTFTRSTVVDGLPVPWEDKRVPFSLRYVVDHCIAAGAYKRFRGVTAGHFAVKLDDQTFLTSRRKTDFNDMATTGLVLVKTDGPDSVVAYGSRPSVGGQSQRIVFADHPDEDCVVHFHCIKREGSEVPTVSQKEFECGSHECGRNTSNGLKQFPHGIKAVYLDNHGPNIVFNKDVDPRLVVDFIEDNFDLHTKSGGYQVQTA